jgi:protein-S-isoprenylcysteine O-methyltransferase Ste14
LSSSAKDFRASGLSVVMASAPAGPGHQPQAAAGELARALEWSEPLAKPRTTRKRLIASKLLVAAVLPFALCAQPVQGEGTLAALALQGAAFVLLLTAAMGRLWASAYISGRKARLLVRDGPYSIIRNPLYFCTLLAHVGAGLAFGSMTVAGIMAAAFFIGHWGTVLEEERWLRSTFGEEFAAYAAVTPRFLPKPRLFREPSRLELDAARFTRALGESSLILLVFPLGLVVAWCHTQGLLPVLLQVR